MLIINVVAEEAVWFINAWSSDQRQGRWQGNVASDERSKEKAAMDSHCLSTFKRGTGILNRFG